MSGECVLQVNNISPSASKDQLQSLFAYVGRIEECRIYPSAGPQNQVKFAYIKFDRSSAVETGQHLTNVVFIDRALICIPAPSNTIPDEETALAAGSTMQGQRQLPPNVISHKETDADGAEWLHTTDPNITALGLTQYPPLPAVTEPAKVEEIRRTVYIGNLEKECDGQQLMDFLNATIGEVMFLRMTASNEYLQCAYAYVEFSNQASVPLALQNNGIEFNGRPLKIQHSRVAIIKPTQKTEDQALEEVEEAIRSKEARGGGDTAPDIGRGYSPLSERSSSRRRSPSPLRRRSPSPLRRRTPSPPARRRTRSPPARSRSPHSSSRRSRSPSPSAPTRRSLSRSPSHRRSRERERKREKKRERKHDRKHERKHSHDRERDRDRDDRRRR